MSYQWYYYAVTEGDHFSDTLTDNEFAVIKQQGVIVPGDGAKQFTLDVLTPSTPGTYYYWCAVINTNGTATDTVTSKATKVTIIDKTLYPQLMNGGFQEFWDWNGMTVNNETMDPSMLPTQGTAFALPPLDADSDQRGMKYWNTTHRNNSGKANYSAGKTTQLQVANGLGQNNTYLDTTGHNIGYDPSNLGPTITGKNDGKTYRAYRDFYVCVELNPDESSSLYQEVATVPGKIYEWSLDHAPRSSSGPKEGPISIDDNIMSVVIGPAINSKDDYNEGVINRWGVGDSTYEIGANETNQYYRYSRKCTYPYGSNPAPADLQSYFRDITQNTTGVGDLTDAVNLNNQSGKNFVSNYNNRQYYVYISSASKTIDNSNPNARKVEWTHRSGVYTVPEGQGLTVFSFVGLLPNSASGNILDNIVFRSGNNPVSATAMYYLGHVGLSAKTEPGYVYGIAEVRGSSITLISNNNITWCASEDCTNADPISPYKTGVFDDPKVSNWFYPDADGTINFNNLTPSKTYRIVGIPIAAVSSTNTNRNPAMVLDDGYYMEITIPAAFVGNNTQMATVTSSAQTCDSASIFLTNTDPDVEYALLDKDTKEVIYEWHRGLGLATGAPIIFKNLKTNHDYVVVGRTEIYKEIDYEDAIPTSGVHIHTPLLVECDDGAKVDDLLRSQVTRVRNGNSDQIILTGVDSDGEYGLYDPADGVFRSLSGIPDKLINGSTATDGTFTFSDLDPKAIYHLAVREKSENGNDTVFRVGIRLYPFPEELSVDYIHEWIELKKDGGYIPKDIQYRMKTDAPGNTWLIGNGKDIDHEDAYTWQPATGTSQLYLGVKRGDSAPILDSIATLLTDTARFYYHLYPVEVDGWAGPYLSPEGTPLAVPRRPDAPVKNDCEENKDNDYTIDYENEKLTVNTTDSLAYSLNNGVIWTTIPDNEIPLTDLGWAAAPISFSLRIPAVEDNSFASEVTVQQLPGRGPAPENLHVSIVDDEDITVTITGLDANKKYQYREQGTTAWSDTANVTELEGLPYYNEDYEIRYAPTCETPASLTQILSVPLYVVPVDFGSIPYGYNKDTISRTISIRNVSEEETSFTTIVLEEGNATSFTIIPPTDPGPTNLVSALGSNTEYQIQPIAGLKAGNYNTTIKITYGSGNTAIATVHLTVAKIQWPDILDATSSNVEAKSFDLCIKAIDEETIPADAIIEYSINHTFDSTGNKGAAVCPVSLDDLDPASEYTIYYRLQEDENHYASESHTHTVYTAYTLNCGSDSTSVVYIDYKYELLKMNEGILPDNYHILVDSILVPNMPYQVSAEAERAAFKVSVVRVGPNSNYPPSDTCSFTVKGRAAAPTGVTVDDANKTIELNDDFEYRVSGNSNIMANWQDATDETNPLSYSGYEVRRPATDTTFASKFTTVYLLAPHVPSDGAIYVDINAAGTKQDGSSWYEATPSLSNALKYADEVNRDGDPDNNIDSIFVAIGTYTPQYGGSGERDKTFTLPPNVVITGGYDASTGKINTQDRSSIISGDLGETGDTTDNSYHVVTANKADSTTLIGFVITGGNADKTGENANGGGIYITNTKDIKLINILIHSNTATGKGGGIYIASNTSSAHITNLTISGNTAASGGGIYNESTDLNIYNTIVFGNTVGEIVGNISDSMHNLINFTGTINQLFVDAANDNYHLKKCSSPAVDKGDSASYKTQRDLGAAFDWLSETDVAGNPRKTFNNIDIGAYENNEEFSITITITTPDAVCNGYALELPTPTILESGGKKDTVGWLLNDLPYTDGDIVSFEQSGDTLKYFAGNECDLTVYSNEVKITVMKAPTFDPITAPAVCAGNSLNLTPPDVNANNGAISNKGWLLNDVIYTNAKVDYAQNGDTLKYFAVNECDSVVSNYVLITVNDVPTISEITAPTAICAGDTLTLPVVTVTHNGSTITNEGWLLNDVIYTNAKVNYVQNGDTLKYFAVNGCDSVFSNKVTITVKPNPIPPTVTTPMNLCVDDSPSLTLAYLAGYVKGQAITWYDADTVELEEIEVLKDTTYWVSQTINGCESSLSNITVHLDNEMELAKPRIPSPQFFCSTGEYHLSDVLVPTGETVRWYKDKIGGTPIENPATTSLNHEDVYYAALLFGECESESRKEVLIRFDDNQTTVLKIGTQSFCTGATIGDIAVPFNHITWYDTKEATTALDPTTLLTTRYYYAKILLDDCLLTNGIDSVKITIGEAEKVSADTSQYFCREAFIYDLKVKKGTGVTWYADNTAGSQPLPVNTRLVDRTVYYAANTSGDCESDRLKITAYMVQAPVSTTCPTDTIAKLIMPSASSIPVNYSVAFASTTPAPAISYQFSGATSASGTGTGSDSLFNVGFTTVTVTAAASPCTAATCTFKVLVYRDTIPPVIGGGTGGVSCEDIGNKTVPIDETESRPNPGEGTYTHTGEGWNITAFDDVDENDIDIWYNLSGKRTDKTATITNDSTTLDGQVFNVDTTLVTWYAKDKSGNIDSCSFTVIVLDNPCYTMTPEQFKFDLYCLKDTVLTLPYGACDMIIELPTPEVEHWLTENELDTVVNNMPKGNRFSSGFYEITWTFTDICDSVRSCSTRVIVNDAPCGIDTIWYIDPDTEELAFRVDTIYAKDHDGNRYSTVRICCECWMAENLRTTKDSAGNSVTSYLYNTERYSDTLRNKELYGRLYDCETAGAICPKGWRLPSVAHYECLIPFGSDALRMPNSWLDDHTATNNTGFSALPAGFYNDLTSSYYYLLGDAYFWTSEQANVSLGQVAHIRYLCPVLEFKEFSISRGASVRCVRVMSEE